MSGDRVGFEPNSGGGTGTPPTGPVGGALSGTLPNPQLNPANLVDFILDPSIAVSSAPRFKTVAELESAVAVGPPGARVWFPPGTTTLSAAPWALPPGTMFFADRSYATGQAVVVVPTAKTMDNFLGAGMGLVVQFSNAAPCLTQSGMGSAPRVLITRDEGALQRLGSAPLMQISDGDIGVWAPSGSDKAVSPNALAPAMEGLGPASVLIGSQLLVAAGGVQAGDFSGQGTLILQNGGAAPVLTAGDFPGFVGTLVQQYSSDPRNFGPQPSGVVLASDGALPFFRQVAPTDLQPAAAALSQWYWTGSSWSENRAGQRVNLALLSDPFFNLTQWFPGEYIALDSANKSYSTSFWDNVGAYAPEADSEKIYRWTAKFSQPLAANTNINVWRRPYGGGEYDTGIQIQAVAGSTLAMNLTDALTIYTGDEIKFVTDTYMSVQHIEIFAHRLDIS